MSKTLLTYKAEQAQLDNLLAKAFNDTIKYEYYDLVSVEAYQHPTYKTNTRAKFKIKASQSSKGPAEHTIHYNRVDLDKLAIGMIPVKKTQADFIQADVIRDCLAGLDYPLAAFVLDDTNKLTAAIANGTLIEGNREVPPTCKLEAKSNSSTCIGSLTLQIDPSYFMED